MSALLEEAQRAERHCLSCSWFDGEHAPDCPHLTGLWPAHGDEVCGRCHRDVGLVYSHVTEPPGPGEEREHDVIVCLGCKTAARGDGR